MGKHRKPASRRVPAVTTGLAIPVVGLFAFAHATDSHLAGLSPLASTSIFVDGTKSFFGSEEGVSPFRMVDAFQGQYDQTVPPRNGTNDFIFYPRSLGPATGFGDPTYDESEGEATVKILQAIRDAKADPDYMQGDDTIYVVGYSQGAGAAAKAIPGLEMPEFAGDKIEIVLAANPRANDGGILTRLPKGVYLPVFGVTFGEGTNPQSNDIKVIQVVKQYDGVADAPAYLFNPITNANAILGYYYLHPGYYKDVDPNDPSAIVTTSADGRITNVLIPAKLGELPLTMPLLQLGVPRNVVEALDPFLRAVIETGYNRPTGPGSYPSEPVPFQLLPPPTRWLSDVQSVAAGATQSAQLLAGAVPSAPALAPAAPTALTAQSADEPEVSGLAVEPEPPPPPEQPESDDVDETDTDPTELDALTPPEGDGANKVAPPPKPKSGWKPGDLLRSIFAPKPTADAESGSDESPSPAGAASETGESPSSEDGSEAVS